MQVLIKQSIFPVLNSESSHLACVDVHWLVVPGEYVMREVAPTLSSHSVLEISEGIFDDEPGVTLAHLATYRALQAEFDTALCPSNPPTCVLCIAEARVTQIVCVHTLSGETSTVSLTTRFAHYGDLSRRSHRSRSPQPQPQPLLQLAATTAAAAAAATSAAAAASGYRERCLEGFAARGARVNVNSLVGCKQSHKFKTGRSACIA